MVVLLLCIFSCSFGKNIFGRRLFENFLKNSLCTDTPIGAEFWLGMRNISRNIKSCNPCMAMWGILISSNSSAESQN